MIDVFTHAENAGDIEGIRMGLNLYADVRKLGRDIIDFNIEEDLLRRGLMGTILGKNIFIDKSMKEDKVHIRFKYEDGSIRVFCRKSSKAWTGEICGHHDCIVSQVMNS